MIECPCGKSHLCLIGRIASPETVAFCVATPEACGLPESLRESTFRSLSLVATLNNRGSEDDKSEKSFPRPLERNPR
ncbi:MAG: hypothetical protein K1X48_08520 [Burkholderiaceae bacterium]|nr:hypothetical protein [Burkholderiaceae bacterium]